MLPHPGSSPATPDAYHERFPIRYQIHHTLYIIQSVCDYTEYLTGKRSLTSMSFICPIGSRKPAKSPSELGSAWVAAGPTPAHAYVL